MATAKARATLGGAASPRRGDLNIGEVLTQLRDQFPGITASKIRFLEEKGLVTPARTSAGYRKYSDVDVDRLRFVLGLQRDQYLPLKVIKEYVDALDQGTTPPALPGGEVVAPRSLDPHTAEEIGNRGAQLDLTELERRSGASAEFLERLRAERLLSAQDDGLFHESALKIVEACLTLAEKGFEPRHLRAFRTAADREIGMVESAVAPLARRKDAAAAARTADEAENLAGAVLQLHAGLLSGGLAHLDR
ncbi:MAG: transcriptional regulator FtsR [Galactobacter sp.]